MSGSSETGTITGPTQQDSISLISGRAYFSDRQLYGYIPIAAVNAADEQSELVFTDSAGYYNFYELKQGIYDLVAITGESEVTFARGVQVDGSKPVQVSQTALLGLSEIIVSNISSTSFKLSFKSNRAARASVEYGPVGSFQEIVTIGQAGATYHEVTLTGLKPFTNYEVSIYLTGDDGQTFIMRGLSAATTSGTGPENLMVAINEGFYETDSHNVTLDLNADNAAEMRIGESYDLSDANWVSYSPTYDYSFKSLSPGTKRVYVQFKDSNGQTSSIQNDSILLNQTGYIGVWINDGDALTNNTDAILSIAYPGATEMKLSNSSSFINSFWEPYIEVKKWKFDSEDGLKTVYCKFKGGQANPDETFTASIIVDTTPPEVKMEINGGDSYTASTTVYLSFNFTTLPTEMKIANSEAPTSEQSWIDFETPYEWEVSTDDEEKTIYALFRDGAGNEYGPISEIIELDTAAPTGNSISIKYDDDATGEDIEFALTASLPVFLHFDVADESTHEARYAITEATTTEPLNLTSVSAPFPPVALYEEQIPVGEHKIWTQFADEAGNTGYFQSQQLTVDGPQIIISPESSELLSDDEQQFTATIKNIEMQDVGSIRWRVINGSGTIDDDGLYTAPAPIYKNSQATVRADSTEISTLYKHATVNLQTSVEMLFQQRGDSFDYDEIEDQVAPDQEFNQQIQILHSNQGIEVSSQPSAGTVAVSAPASFNYGVVATLTYNAPDVAPSPNEVFIGVRSVEKPQTVVGTISLLISTGPNIALSASNDKVQRNSPIDVSADIKGTDETDVNWTLSPANWASFDQNDNSVNTTTSSPDHDVSIYAAEPSQIKQASLTATIDGTSKSYNFSVYPPISFQINPVATSALPLIDPITFKAQSFDYMLDTATESVTWEFKNASRPDFMPADGKTYIDRGSLTVIDSTTAEYRRPTKLPSETDTTAADYIVIRATAKSDPTASNTAIATITPNVEVKVYKTIEKDNPITEAETVAEVGKIQFFADVTPSVIGNTAVSWTVNGVTESEQYGSIDQNGLYTAPDEIVVNEVTVRASSDYDPTAFASVDVSLSPFWMPKRQNMTDSITDELMPIESLLVNPYTASGTGFEVYAGTIKYGVWRAFFSDTPGDTSGGDWEPIQNLSSDNQEATGKYFIGSLVISPDEYIYAGTKDGIWYIPTSGAAQKVTGDEAANNPPDENYLKLEFHTQHSEYLFATTPGGVYRLELQDPQTCSGWQKILNTTDPFKDSELESRTDDTASPPVTVSAYTNTYNDNPIDGILKTIAYDDYNNRLYAGGEDGIFLYMKNTSVPNLIETTADAFVANPPSVATTLSNFYLLSGNQPEQNTLAAPPLDMALDQINRSTIWAATVGGVYRSVDNGTTWTAKGFGTGSTVNTRAIIVDPTNTINVLAGSEDGLYRSTDAGGSWKRIRSGLGNHKTITCLIQAAGRAGERRKVWVGTAGGVFMGRQSLDLE
ncbi:MAG: hypothetical protein ACQETH_04230 [Candidatus Rifleibacteriota bacterium]